MEAGKCLKKAEELERRATSIADDVNRRTVLETARYCRTLAEARRVPLGLCGRDTSNS